VTNEKQKAANRRNALHSTGPKTVKGKATASMNAIRHGLSAGVTVLPDEDPQAFQELYEKLQGELQPIGTMETALIDLITRKLWRLGRISHIENGVLTWEYYQKLLDNAQIRMRRCENDRFLIPTTLIEDEDNHKIALEQWEDLIVERDNTVPVSGQAFRQDADGADVLSKLCRYETTLENGLYRALRQFRELQENRVAVGT
jgi:hypothetical protein